MHSVLQLELLLLMRENGGEWTAAGLAREMRITEHSADSHLRELEVRRLLERGSAPGAFRYVPRSVEVDIVVGDLAKCYAVTRYAVIDLILSVPADSARCLADAFRLRRTKIQ